MTVKELMEKLSEFEPDMRVFFYDNTGPEGYYAVARRVHEWFFSDDSEELYADWDSAIENEAEDWGGELEPVVVIGS